MDGVDIQDIQDAVPVEIIMCVHADNKRAIAECGLAKVPLVAAGEGLGSNFVTIVNLSVVDHGDGAYYALTST
jgi:hypothetical protein